LVDADQAHINHDASSWDIGDFDSNQTKLAFNSTAETPWVHYSTLPIDSLAKLVVPDLLQAPQLGNAQGPPGIPEMFPACLDRNMSVESALVQPLNGHLSVPDNLDIIPALQYTFNSSSGFRLRANWTASMPNDCKGSARTGSGVDYSKLVSLGQFDVAEWTIHQAPPVADSNQQCTHPPGAGGGGGAYLADFVIALMATSTVEKMLPFGVQLPLAARILPVTPVMFVFGYQYGVCDNTDSTAWLDGRSFVLNYNEFIMAIPDVEFSNPPKGQPRGSHTYQPKLFLDGAVPMALGWGFGIDKVLAHFEHDEAAGSWSVKDWDNNVEMLALKSKNTTGWLPLPSFSADSVVGLLTTALQGDGFGTPILGLSGRGYRGDTHGQGFFTCGVFSWDLLDHAEVQLFHGEMNVRQAVDDGHVMKAFNHQVLTGVRLRTNWTMSFPNDCSHPAQPGVARESWLKLRDHLIDTSHSVVV